MKLSNVSDAVKHKVGKYIIFKIRPEDGLTTPLKDESLISLGNLFFQVLKNNKLGEIPQDLANDFNQKFIFSDAEYKRVIQTGAKKFLEYCSEKERLGDNSFFTKIYPDSITYIADNIYDPEAKGHNFVSVEDSGKNSMLEDALSQFLNKEGSSKVYISQLQVLTFAMMPDENHLLRKGYKELESFWAKNQAMDFNKFKKKATQFEKELEKLMQTVTLEKESNNTAIVRNN